MPRAVTQYLTRAAEWTGFGEGLLRRIVVTLVVLLVALGLRALVLRLLVARVADGAQRYRWRRAVSYSTSVVTLLALARVWFIGFQSIATLVGLLGAGLAVALRDVVASFAAWLLILWRRPFESGDRISVGGVAGDVIDVRMLQFSLLEIGNWVHADQSTGRIVHVPNSALLTQPVANYTKSFPYIWNEVEVPLTFESDWRRAKDLIAEILRGPTFNVAADAERRALEASAEYDIHWGKLTPIVYTATHPYGVLLTARYLTPVRARRATQEQLWEAILDAFAGEPKISFALPFARLEPRSGKTEPVRN